MQQIGLLQIQTASSKNKLNAKAMEKPIQVSYPMKKKDASEFQSLKKLLLYIVYFSRC